MQESACNAGGLGLIPGSARSLQKEMGTHFSTLAWKISWTEEPGGLQSMGSQRVGHNWATNTYLLTLNNKYLSEIRVIHLTFICPCSMCLSALLLPFEDNIMVSYLANVGSRMSRNWNEHYSYNTDILIRLIKNCLPALKKNITSIS